MAKGHFFYKNTSDASDVSTLNKIARKKPLIIISVLALVIVGLISVVSTSSGRQGTTKKLSSTLTALQGKNHYVCPRGMSTKKCDEELGLIPIPPYHHSGPIPTLAPLPTGGPPSPTLINCGASFSSSGHHNFFSSGQQAEMTQAFGQNYLDTSSPCFRIQGIDDWIYTASGGVVNTTFSQNGTAINTYATGGAIVAIEQCAANDQACLNPNTPHNFDNFTVYYPPYPQNSLIYIGTLGTPGDYILSFMNDCDTNGFVFDLQNKSWYSSQPAGVSNSGVKQLNDLDNILRGDYPPVVPTPPPVSALTALSSPAPNPIPSAISFCESPLQPIVSNSGTNSTTTTNPVSNSGSGNTTTTVSNSGTNSTTTTNPVSNSGSAN